MPNKEIIELQKELRALRSKSPGSELVSVLNEIAFAELHSDPGKAEACALEAQEIAEKQGFPVDQARSCTILGQINQEAGNYVESMSYCRKAMELNKRLEDKNGMASVLRIIAGTYKSQGIIDKALEYYHESLSQKQECGASDDELAISYLNIGACYSGLHRLDLAQSSYEYARKILEESGDREKLAYVYNNIGVIYGEKRELDRAQEFFQKALGLREELGDKRGIAATLGNLGSMYEKLGDYESAVDCFKRSLELFEEIGNKRGVAFLCCNIGGTYTKLGRLDEAETLIIRGLEITRELEVKDVEIHCLDEITELYKSKGDMQKALQHSRELNTCVEEHLNEKSMEKIAGLQVQFETEKKEKEAEIYRLKNVELSSMNDQLRDTLADVKRLQGMLPICASCKKVRDDDGYWQRIESYITEHSDAKFSHGLCPECMVKLYGKDFTRKLNSSKPVSG